MSAQTIADFTAKLPNGEEISLADKLGKVINTTLRLQRSLA